jgi:hypothetical protein
VPCWDCGGDGFAKPPGWPDKAEMTHIRTELLEKAARNRPPERRV